MIEKEGTEEVHECDLCILAMGFVGPEKVGDKKIFLSIILDSNRST